MIAVQFQNFGSFELQYCFGAGVMKNLKHSSTVERKNAITNCDCLVTTIQRQRTAPTVLVTVLYRQNFF